MAQKTVHGALPMGQREWRNAAGTSGIPGHHLSNRGFSCRRRHTCAQATLNPRPYRDAGPGCGRPVLAAAACQLLTKAPGSGASSLKSPLSNTTSPPVTVAVTSTSRRFSSGAANTVIRQREKDRQVDRHDHALVFCCPTANADPSCRHPRLRRPSGARPVPSGHPSGCGGSPCRGATGAGCHRRPVNRRIRAGPCRFS